ncbi:MAG: hypothetical protein ACPGN5_05740, partial [Porticoccaceae bacterium]
MNKTLSAILAKITGAAVICLVSSISLAGTVQITYENSGTSSKNAGLHELSIDGVSTYAMNGKVKPPKKG